MITTYAQNFEDVLLWRALGHVENGQYVDVGANDPSIDSVTRLFYEHGWRGINIEPMPDMYERLVEARPDDVSLRCAAGDVAGELTLFDVVGTGLSTLDAEQGARLREDGMSVVERSTEIATLNDILTEHAKGPIHFLKIDVEGAEQTVLAGCDLPRWRPWVLVIEATAPRSQRVVAGTWEPGVLAGGYSKAYFDGLNNYYVSDEHPELLDSFHIQPNVFDDFYLPLSHGRISNSEIQAVRQVAQDLATTQTLVVTLEEWGRESEEWAKTIETQLQQSQSQRVEIQAKYDVVRAKNEAMRRSASWRVTFPIRAFSLAARASAHAGAPAAKAFARPVLNAGLNAVRKTPWLKSGLHKVFRAVPVVGSRLEGYAASRPKGSEDRG
jgi:FkbM family methyltransferase